MGFIEDVVVNAKVAAGNVGKFAGDVVDISKLKFDSAEISRKIDIQYKNLGKMVYNASLKGECCKEDIMQKSDEITALKEKLNVLENKAAALQKKVKCTECGSLNEENANFCKKCGAKLEKVVVTEAEVIDAEEACSCSADETVKEDTPLNNVEVIINGDTSKDADDTSEVESINNKNDLF